MDDNVAASPTWGRLPRIPATYTLTAFPAYRERCQIFGAATRSVSTLGASHPDRAAPPVAACSNIDERTELMFDFCQFSRDEMNTYLAANSGCLTIVSIPPS
jgi:hypothetical protein